MARVNVTVATAEKVERLPDRVDDLLEGAAAYPGGSQGDAEWGAIDEGADLLDEGLGFGRNRQIVVCALLGWGGIRPNLTGQRQDGQRIGKLVMPISHIICDCWRYKPVTLPLRMSNSRA